MTLIKITKMVGLIIGKLEEELVMETLKSVRCLSKFPTVDELKEMSADFPAAYIVYAGRRAMREGPDKDAYSRLWDVTAIICAKNWKSDRGAALMEEGGIYDIVDAVGEALHGEDFEADLRPDGQMITPIYWDEDEPEIIFETIAVSSVSFIFEEVI